MNPLDAWARPPATGLRATWLGHSLDGVCDAGNTCDENGVTTMRFIIENLLLMSVPLSNGKRLVEPARIIER